jgi:hypothetical protein
MKMPIVLEPQLALCALAVLLFMTVVSFAQQSTAPERPRKACAADYKKLCADAKQGDGRIAQCMRDHAAELSASCKTSLQAVEAKRAGRRSSAKPPAQ